MSIVIHAPGLYEVEVTLRWRGSPSHTGEGQRTTKLTHTGSTAQQRSDLYSIVDSAMNQCARTFDTVTP